MHIKLVSCMDRHLRQQVCQELLTRPVPRIYAHPRKEIFQQPERRVEMKPVKLKLSVLKPLPWEPSDWSTCLFTLLITSKQENGFNFQRCRYHGLNYASIIEPVNYLLCILFFTVLIVIMVVCLEFSFIRNLVPCTKQRA